MSIINSNAKEIHCKIVYCGPEGSGKSSCLEFIKKHTDPARIKELKLPIDPIMSSFVLSVGKILDFETFFHVYDLSSYSLEEKRILIRGTDGLIFVANCDSSQEEQNKQAFEEITNILKQQNRDLFKIPLTIQYNKKDLPQTIDVATLRAQINKYNNKDFESSTIEGKNILEPLKHVCKFVLTSIRSGEML